MRRVSVAICPDFPEERWPSMDRVAERLAASLARHHPETVEATAICPAFRRRAARLWPGPAASKVDRGVNRLIDYPRHVRARAGAFDVFHVVDHSYAQLVHFLPSNRTIVTCHDLDTFRSVLHPAEERRSLPFTAMTRHILAGLRRAARVTCDTAAVRDELVARQIVSGDTAVVVPIGVGDEFCADPDPERDRAAARLIASAPGAVEILHVGSTVPRKRVEFLLRCFAEIRIEVPQAHLVRVGGPFTPEQVRLVRNLGLATHISVLPPIDDRMLAAVYRRAALLLLPSEREGFGLPIVEALRCGTPVAASDLPALREVGGSIAEFCAMGDLPSWTRTALRLIRQDADAPALRMNRRAAGLVWSRRFTWTSFADRMTSIYTELARRRPIVEWAESHA